MFGAVGIVELELELFGGKRELIVRQDLLTFEIGLAAGLVCVDVIDRLNLFNDRAAAGFALLRDRLADAQSAGASVVADTDRDGMNRGIVTHAGQAGGGDVLNHGVREGRGVHVVHEEVDSRALENRLA